MMPRRGFAMAAVLAALVIMAMVVAVDAQRALLVARQGNLDMTRTEMAAAVAGAKAAVLELPADTVSIPAFLPGALLARGETSAGRARAQWTLVGAAAPFAVAEIEVEAPFVRGAARERHRALVVRASDAGGGVWWEVATPAGWVRIPSS